MSFSFQILYKLQLQLLLNLVKTVGKVKKGEADLKTSSKFPSYYAIKKENIIDKA